MGRFTPLLSMKDPGTSFGTAGAVGGVDGGDGCTDGGNAELIATGEADSATPGAIVAQRRIKMQITYLNYHLEFLRRLMRLISLNIRNKRFNLFRHNLLHNSW